MFKLTALALTVEAASAGNALDTDLACKEKCSLSSGFFCYAELKLLNLQPGKIRFFPYQWNLKALVQASPILLSKSDVLLSCFPMLFPHKHLILLGKVIFLAD